MLLNPQTVAERAGISASTLAKLRVSGGGPPFKKLGAKVLYDEAELTAWIESRPSFSSTAEAGSKHTGRRRGPRPIDTPESQVAPADEGGEAKDSGIRDSLRERHRRAA